jgi:hypothetical protein
MIESGKIPFKRHSHESALRRQTVVLQGFGPIMVDQSPPVTPSVIPSHLGAKLMCLLQMLSH